MQQINAVKIYIAFVFYTVLLLVISSSAGAEGSNGNTEFSQYKNAQQVNLNSYIKVFQAEFEQFQQLVLQRWPEAKTTTQNQWVEYGEDLLSRRVVDYDKNEIEVTLFLDGGLASSSLEADPEIKNKFQKHLEGMLGETIRQAHAKDILGQRIRQRTGTEVQTGNHLEEKVLGELFTEEQSITQLANELLLNSTISFETVSLKSHQPEQLESQYIKIIIPLPEDRTLKKAFEYKQQVTKSAAKWNIQESLVFAIMHTESHFNPMARSYVPAYGLMQVVPYSAGKDASQLIYGDARLLSADFLFSPENNINVGSAYLNILMYRYMRGIEDPLSRLYCTIAAYNTGASNVALAFIEKKSMRDAVAVINTMNPGQVYQRLLHHLPYEETRNYVENVVKRERIYKKI